MHVLCKYTLCQHVYRSYVKIHLINQSLPVIAALSDSDSKFTEIVSFAVLCLPLKQLCEVLQYYVTTITYVMS